MTQAETLWSDAVRAEHAHVTAHRATMAIPIWRVELVREGSHPYLGNPVSAAKVLHELLPPTLDREHFGVLMLNTRNEPIGWHIVSIGCLNGTNVHPREVFKAALLASAAAMIAAHNHPSGDPSPSREDIDLTRRLVEVGKLIGISVIDHIIVGAGRHYSFQEGGLL